ncbi:MAG: SHOCT domain-containing protein [Coriobacteriales bacterium]|jgi:membrane protease subunit (stomatin/prohibitin family)|nr:SHOCT domain-containing protein [Coriobacteriales bacterium]
MGFIQAFVGALGGTFADQWKDFYTVPLTVRATTGVIAAVKQETNAGRGANVKGSDNIITNGSTVIVPEGYGLVTMESGAFTGFIAQAGGYVYTSTDPNAQSFFSGGGLIDSVIRQTWERFKFGGIPGTQQQAFYVNLKEIPDNKFGTNAEIYWDDAYLQAQVGAITRGFYSLRITDPLLFIKQFVPAQYLIPGGPDFDFADPGNQAAHQLFVEVVASLSAALSDYTNDPDKGNRITKIQHDSVGFANSLGAAVEDGHRWQADRGLTIVKAALLAIEYDEDSKAVLADVRRATALAGERGQSFLQQSVARGLQAAGENPNGGGGIGMAFMGMGLNAAGGMAQGLQQPFAQPQAALAPRFDPQTGQPIAQPFAQPQAAPAPLFDPQTGQPLAQPMAAPAPAPAPAAAEDPYEKLTRLKGLLDSGVITQADFDAAKAQLLGL